jgi:hypothetical protein
VTVAVKHIDLALCTPVAFEPRRDDVWLLGDGHTQRWRPGDRGAPAGKWHEKADVLLRPPSPYGPPADYATPAMVTARQALGAPVCCDPDCHLSGGYAHVGDCTPCGCEKRHAAAECPERKA